MIFNILCRGGLRNSNDLCVTWIGTTVSMGLRDVLLLVSKPLLTVQSLLEVLGFGARSSLCILFLIEVQLAIEVSHSDAHLSFQLFAGAPWLRLLR